MSVFACHFKYLANCRVNTDGVFSQSFEIGSEHSFLHLRHLKLFFSLMNFTLHRFDTVMRLNHSSVAFHFTLTAANFGELTLVLEVVPQLLSPFYVFLLAKPARTLLVVYRGAVITVVLYLLVVAENLITICARKFLRGERIQSESRYLRRLFVVDLAVGTRWGLF